MIRRFIVAAAIALFGVSVAASYTDVTFVMKNGVRVHGTFSYNHTDHYQIVVNGRERDYPSDDIALLVFNGGDPTAEEVNRLPTAGDPPELERHTIVLRSGEMIRGKIYDFQGDRIIMDMGPNDRRTFSMNDTARLYISAPGSRALFANSNAAANANPNSAVVGGRRGGAMRRGGITINLPGSSCWVDTGINVVANQLVSFAATGEITTSADVNDVATVIGSKTGRVAGPNAPISNALLGMLIARIDGNAPFEISNHTQALTMPQNGRLWIGVNDSQCNDNSGSFRVTIRQ
jgi:hypothetical protein